MRRFIFCYVPLKHKYIYTVSGFTGEYEAANGNYWKLETIPANISSYVNTYHEIYTNGKCFIVYGWHDSETWILINDIEKFDPWGDEAFRAFAYGFYQSPTWNNWYLTDRTVIKNAVTFYTNKSNDYYTIAGAGELYNGNYYLVDDYDPDDYDHSSPYISEMYDIYTNGEHRLIINKSNNSNMLIVSEFFSPGYGNYDNFDDIKFECTNGIWKEKAENFESGYSTLELTFHERRKQQNPTLPEEDIPETDWTLQLASYPTFLIENNPTLEVNGEYYEVKNSSTLSYEYFDTKTYNFYVYDYSDSQKVYLIYASTDEYQGWVLTTNLSKKPEPYVSSGKPNLSTNTDGLGDGVIDSMLVPDKHPVSNNWNFTNIKFVSNTNAKQYYSIEGCPNDIVNGYYYPMNDHIYPVREDYVNDSVYSIYTNGEIIMTESHMDSSGVRALYDPLYFNTSDSCIYYEIDRNQGWYNNKTSMQEENMRADMHLESDPT